MSVLSYIWRMTRRYVLSPESFFVIVILIVLYNTVVNFAPILQKAKQKLSFKFSPAPIFKKTDEPSSENLYWPSDPSKTSWEYKGKSVSVYSIQGRRPHMEDRFHVMEQENGTKHSIYAIYDGHGGDVWLFIKNSFILFYQIYLTYTVTLY